jgi:hypothetical protein
MMVSSHFAGCDPDFLYAALDVSAYAAFFTERRRRLIDSNKPHRKSGKKPLFILEPLGVKFGASPGCPVFMSLPVHSGR